jgi:foldase protein PrsA
MKIRLLSVPVLLALVASLAACGGSQNVPSSAVAVVNGTPVTLAQFNDFFAQALARAKAGGQPASPGTPQYTAMRAQTVSELVQLAELKQQATKEHVSVSQGDVNKFLANLVTTKFQGSQAKFQAALKTAGLTTQSAKEQVFINLLAEKLHAKVTASAKVTADQARAFYNSNIAQYTVPKGSTTRNIAHILVATKAAALKIEKQLQHGANFATLAKQYSTDTGSAQNGGQLCMSKSGTAGPCQQMVAPFAKVAWKLKTGQISPPVHSQFGWHVIKAVGPIMKGAYTQPFSLVQVTITQNLVQQKQGTVWQQWITDLQNEYKGKVSYQSGYAPPTTTASATLPPATTG